MGTIIKSSYASPDGPQSSIGMAVFAVQNCLKKVGMHVQDVDVLINIGVFRDKNIVEPAMAPLIQQQLGMNLDPVQNDHIHRTTLFLRHQRWGMRFSYRGERCGWLFEKWRRKTCAHCFGRHSSLEKRSSRFSVPECGNRNSPRSFTRYETRFFVLSFQDLRQRPYRFFRKCGFKQKR